MQRAQLQTQETILVLFIIVILIIAGIAFFLKYQTQTIQQERRAYERTHFQDIITTLPESALIKCSKATQKESCVDSLKLLAANQKTLKRIYGDINITIYQVYPAAPAALCTKTNLIACNTWLALTPSGNPIKNPTKAITPISLYRPEQNTYVLALLIAETSTL